MNNANPIDLLYGGMEKLGPGSDEDTRHVLGLLPKQAYRTVVDAGCGTGRQTLVLVSELGTLIHAVDTYEPFLEALKIRAAKAGIERLIDARCMNMNDIPSAFPHIDLLWSEGAAYNIGFSNALGTWAQAIDPGGWAAVSEMSWLRDNAPGAVKEFFLACYPEMKSVGQNLVIAEKAGYRALATHTLPRSAWVEGYYDVLRPKARALLHHPEVSVREIAAEMMREIDVFEISEDSLGYVFFVLQRC